MRNWVLIAAAALTVPGVALDLGAYGPSEPAIQTLVFGVVFVGAGFLLSWAAVVPQFDISEGQAFRSARPDRRPRRRFECAHSAATPLSLVGSRIRRCHFNRKGRDSPWLSRALV